MVPSLFMQLIWNYSHAFGVVWLGLVLVHSEVVVPSRHLVLLLNVLQDLREFSVATTSHRSFFALKSLALDVKIISLMGWSSRGCNPGLHYLG